MEAKTKKRKRRIKQLCDLERFEADVAANLEREGNKERRRDKSARNTPSSTWADAKWYGDLREVLKDGTIQQDRRKVEFPPGADNTGMVMCCDGRYYPPQYVVTGPDGRKYSYDDAQATWADAGGGRRIGSVVVARKGEFHDVD